MPKNEGALFFLVVILCSTDSVYCLASWCRDQWQGFSLDEDYNPNSPPTKEFILYDAHVLHKVDEVLLINLLQSSTYLLIQFILSMNQLSFLNTCDILG